MRDLSVQNFRMPFIASCRVENGANIFEDDDRLRFLEILGAYCQLHPMTIAVILGKSKYP